MHSNFRRMALAGLFALLCGTGAFAQGSTSPAQSTTPPMGHQGMGGMNHDEVRDRLQHLSEQLNLTDEQKQQLKPVLTEEMKKMQAVRANTSLTPQQKHEQMMQIHQEARPKISGILTPDQKKKFEMMKQENMKRHGGQMGGAPNGMASKP